MNSRYKELEISIKKKLNGNFMGSFNSAFKWLWVEFESLREYIPGDSIKSIDWKTTAKLGSVHVKNYEEEKDLNVLFYIQLTDSLSFWSKYKTKQQTLEEIFFLLAQCSISHWLSIGGYITFDTHRSIFIEFSKWEETIIRILKILEQPLDYHVQSKHIPLKNLHCKNNLIFILSDSIIPQHSEITYLNTYNEIIYLSISDDFENNLISEEIDISYWNGFSKKLFAWFLWITKQKDTKKKKYIELRQKKIEHTKKTLGTKNISSLNISDTDDIFLVFYKFFMNYKH